MTKFSDFIRAPGTAGPPTQEGIRALGFALRSDFPVELQKYLWLGGAQNFTVGEKTQGRSNLGVVIGTDVQAFSPSLASLAGLTTAAGRLAYTTAANTWAMTVLTPFARSLLDDADAAAVRTTIGLSTITPSDGTVTTSKLADGALSADVAGRAKMADGFVNAAKTASDLVSGQPPKAAVVDADQVLIADSVAGGAKKKTEFSAVWDWVRNKILSLFGASGAAPVFACRAWVNFNGTGTVAIRSSGNVSSVTDLGTGSYRVNFTTALPDDGYAVVLGASYTNATSAIDQTVSGGRLAASVQVQHFESGTLADTSDFSVAIFR